MLLLCFTVAALPGCSLFHRHGSAAGCREPTLAATAATLPPLRVPAGMSAPDTHNAVRIPSLDEPEPSRPRSAPCLSMPPSFAVPETHAPPVRSSVPLPPAPGAAGNGPQ